MANVLIYATVAIAAIFSLMVLLVTVMSGVSRYRSLVRAKSKSRPATERPAMTEWQTSRFLKEDSFRLGQIAGQAGKATPRGRYANVAMRLAFVSRKHAETPLPIIACAF